MPPFLLAIIEFEFCREIFSIGLEESKPLLMLLQIFSMPLETRIPASVLMIVFPALDVT
jgi:hypothetical protein